MELKSHRSPTSQMPLPFDPETSRVFASDTDMLWPASTMESSMMAPSSEPSNAVGLVVSLEERDTDTVTAAEFDSCRRWLPPCARMLLMATSPEDNPKADSNRLSMKVMNCWYPSVPGSCRSLIENPAPCSRANSTADSLAQAPMPPQTPHTSSVFGGGQSSPFAPRDPSPTSPVTDTTVSSPAPQTRVGESPEAVQHSPSRSNTASEPVQQSPNLDTTPLAQHWLAPSSTPLPQTVEAVSHSRPVQSWSQEQVALDTKHVPCSSHFAPSGEEQKQSPHVLPSIMQSREDAGFASAEHCFPDISSTTDTDIHFTLLVCFPVQEPAPWLVHWLHLPDTYRYTSWHP